jgi:methyl-accepting chemotaxis protein
MADTGGAAVRQTVEGMRRIDESVGQGAQSVMELGERSKEIGRIIEVISAIADQTNLLALNAAIEAARAAEHGRGFAVVADEVRKLAERTSNATEDVSRSVQVIQQQTGVAVDVMGRGRDEVRSGVGLAENAGTSLSRIVESTAKVAEMIERIAATSSQQTSAAEMIANSIQQVQAAAEQSAEAAQASAEVAVDLSSKARDLEQLVGRFRVDAAGKTTPARPAQVTSLRGKWSPGSAGEQSTAQAA